jgi:hypothetical protein
MPSHVNEREALAMAKHDPRIDARVAGDAWQGQRDTFYRVHKLLLDVHPLASSELTTIYAKYKIDERPMSPVFAAVWLKSSQNVWLGLALPALLEDPATCSAPAGMKYKGLTTYIRITPDRELPADFNEWVFAAYKNIRQDMMGSSAA